ncbi:Ig-like domain-containing protein [Comamonas sp. JC664]|uniref:Ig-like domain-containing protein n=1 Tax=Comamonas sp. JC664 TaxID=2801917 RepID=UPI00191F725B|nr:Ig-like domain-containing protein [Comamonas sp. JC664]
MMVTMGTGCGDECADQFDCRSDKGAPAPGKQWTCNSGTCEQRDVTAPPPDDAGTDPETDAGTDAGTDPDAGAESCTSNATCALTETCNVEASTCEPSAFETPVATTSTQIQAVRDAADGELDAALPIEGAFVTFIKPAVAGSTEPVGFFVQAEAQGPALFVTDATALGLVTVGDRVSFSVTSKATTDGLRNAPTVTGTTVISQGHPVKNLSTATPAGLAVDRSAETSETLVTGLDSVESELTYLTGTIGTSGGIGAGYLGFQITTTGITTGAANFRLRVPAALVTELDIEPGCTFTLNAGPLWRFGTNAQPSAFTASDLTLTNCAAPTFSSASATSLTEVVLNFSRSISAASITNAQEQFTFTEGLTVSAARVEGKQVFLTTSEQTPGTTYSVTVATTVTDRTGGTVAPEAATQSFRGFRQPAVLRLTEIQPNMGSNRDLVELQVITAGTTANIVLQMDVNSPRHLATLPDVDVAEGDIIVVHLNPDATFREETLAKDESPRSTYAANYDTAWDFRGFEANDITYSSRIVLVKDAAGTIQDAVSFRTAGNPPAAFPGNLQAIQAAGQWLPADCGGALCTATSTPTAADVSVNWAGIPNGANTTNNSVRRISATDTNTAADWAVGAPSWGLPNPM